jgi:excisionase family DNA binding protein
VIDKVGANVYPMVEDRKLDRLLTIQEICQLLNLPKSAIYALTHQKRIPHIKIARKLRFRESAIIHWLESLEVNDGSSEGREQGERQVVRRLDIAKRKAI